MKLHKPGLAALIAVSVVLTLGAVAPGLAGDDDENGIPFAEAELFFELNNTDGDLGIHALIDGDAWKKLQIEDLRERKMLKVRVSGRLRRQGLTEIFFESAEPTFDQLAPARFFRRFPAGEYEIEGLTLEGDELESEVELTHVMPAPPVTGVNGEPEAQVCDDEDPDFDAPEVSAPITVEWAEVTMSHDDAEGGGAGVQPPVEVEIHNYEVVVEVEFELDGGEEFASVFSIILPPGETSVTLPEELVGLGDEFKYEVLAREASFNQTATESCFLLAANGEE